MFPRLFGLSVLASLVLVASPSSAFHAAPEVRAGMLRATDLLLNRDVEAAETECRSLLMRSEGEAAGKFCLGLVTLTRAEDKDDPTPDLDRFLAQAADTVAAAEALERSRPADAEVKLLLGLAHGNKALVDGGRKNYLAAFTSLREAHRRFEEALKLDPKLADAYYGIGLYNYALGRLPVLLKPLVSIVLPPGPGTGGGARDLSQDDGAGRPSAPVRQPRGAVRGGAAAGAGPALTVPGECGPILRNGARCLGAWSRRRRPGDRAACGSKHG